MTLNNPASTASVSKTMIKDIEELTISLAIANFNPTLLTYELLTMSGVVPLEWELARQPIVSPRGSQINFKNGINILAQGNMVSFVEGLRSKDINALEFAKTAQKYVQKMSNADYQGISFSPKIVVAFPEDNGGNDFINNQLLNQGQWRSFGNVTPQASLNLFYQLDRCQFTLNINPAKLQQSQDIVISAVLFAGSFNYNLTQFLRENRLNKINDIINNWHQDLDVFRELVYQKYLQKAVPQKESLFEN